MKTSEGVSRRGRHPGPPELRRERSLRIPVRTEEHAVFRVAAEAAGLPVATWMRQTLLRAAGALPEGGGNAGVAL